MHPSLDSQYYGSDGSLGWHSCFVFGQHWDFQPSCWSSQRLSAGCRTKEIMHTTVTLCGHRYIGAQVLPCVRAAIWRRTLDNDAQRKLYRVMRCRRSAGHRYVRSAELPLSPLAGEGASRQAWIKAEYICGLGAASILPVS